jgi:hypothetical protein
VISQNTPLLVDGDDCGAVGGMNDWQGKPKCVLGGNLPWLVADRRILELIGEGGALESVVLACLCSGRTLLRAGRWQVHEVHLILPTALGPEGLLRL